MALGVLTQPWGPHQQPIAYLSRELDVISDGWPHYLRVIGAVTLLAPEALKITDERNLTVLTSCNVSGILNSKVNIWKTDSRLLKYQLLMLEGPVTKLKVCGNLNPATFLPEKENETPNHDCLQFLTLNYAAQEDLMATPLDNPDMEIFTSADSRNPESAVRASRQCLPVLGSYTAFHSQSNCWACGVFPWPSVKGFSWWTSPLQGKDFFQVCKYFQQQLHVMPLLKLVTSNNLKMDWYNYGHNVTFHFDFNLV